MRILCVLAIPRTGSSHLNKLLKSCPEMNAKSELFHRHLAVRFRRPERAALEKRGAPVADAARLCKWMRNHPTHTLDALYEGGGSKIVTFKVFPHHLSRKMLKSEIFSRGDCAFAFLKRRPIDAYISHQKAKSTQTFTIVDTTAIKPELNAEQFVDWAQKMRMWYNWSRKELEQRGLPFVDISYDRHLDGLSGMDSLSQILPLIEPLGFSALSMPGEAIEGERQDRERRYQDRVANWTEFEAKVRADPANAKLLNWAERAP